VVPVEERLRSALVDLVDDVVVDSEEPLERVHRRRTRALATVWGGCAAALVALTLGAVGLLLPPSPTSAPPTSPPAAGGSDAPARLFPVGTYTRAVTSDEVLAAGLAPGEVRHLFDGGQRATLMISLRARPDAPDTDLSVWQLWFVAADGTRRIRDGGGYYMTSDGEVSLVSQWFDCMGCTYYYGWDLDGRRLTLDPSSRTLPRPMASLLEGGPWLRRP
jgi:hypothetical protein